MWPSPHGTKRRQAPDQAHRRGGHDYPEGIDWNGDKVKLVVGIAAKGDEHLEILGRIVGIASTDEDTDALVAQADAEAIYRKFNGLE